VWELIFKSPPFRKKREKGGPPAQLQYDANSDDNQIGLGTTPTTWDVK
jgi:hypothetical protein